MPGSARMAGGNKEDAEAAARGSGGARAGVRQGRYSGCERRRGTERLGAGMPRRRDAGRGDVHVFGSCEFGRRVGSAGA